MPDFSTEIDIEPWEYISACSKREVKELIESVVTFFSTSIRGMDAETPVAFGNCS